MKSIKLILAVLLAATLFSCNKESVSEAPKADPDVIAVRIDVIHNNGYVVSSNAVAVKF